MVRSWKLWATTALALVSFAAGHEEYRLEARNVSVVVGAEASPVCEHKKCGRCYDHCFEGGPGSCAAYFQKAQPPKVTVTLTVPVTATVTETSISTSISTSVSTSISTSISTSVSTSISTSISTSTSTSTATVVQTSTVVSTVVSTVSKTDFITATISKTDTITTAFTATATERLTTTTTSTSLTTVTTVFPPITVTMTLSGSTVFSTIPASTLTVTSTIEVIQTITQAPRTIILATNTPSPVSACSAPTGLVLGVSQPSSSRLKWGCEPGYICSPPKPGACNAWGTPPPKNYVCEPQYCRLAPSPERAPITNRNEIGWVPPNPFYFNLDPKEFGLSNSIFEKHEVVEVVEGKTTTITTGDWTAHGSVAQPTIAPRSPAPYMHEPQKRQPSPEDSKVPRKTMSWKQIRSFMQRGVKSLYRRQNSGLPENLAICFQPCNEAFIEASYVGLVPRLCTPGSPYQDSVMGCTECFDEFRNQTQTGGVRAYVADQFEEYLNFCAVSDGTTPPTGLQSQVTGDPTVTSGAQGGAATSGAPIPITSTSATATTTTTTQGSSVTSSAPVVSNTTTPPTVPAAGVVLSNSSPIALLLLALFTVMVAAL